MTTAAADYGLGQEVLEKGHQYFTNYQEKHKVVTDFLKENPTGKEAFRSLFLAKPKGVIEISKDPVSIYLVCHSQEDYAWIYNQKVFWQDRDAGEKQVDVDENELQRASMSGGVKLNNTIQPQLAGMKLRPMKHNMSGTMLCLIKKKIFILLMHCIKIKTCSDIYMLVLMLEI